MTSPTIPLDPKALAAIYPSIKPAHVESIVVPQMEQRIELVRFWEVQSGEKVLEIGCGQGDTTLILATAVGEHGHVTALDPASLDYGSPFTLGQAQAHLKASPVGDRVDFLQDDPLAFLAKTTETYTAAVISLCIWYFSSPAYLRSLLAALVDRAERICIAEYALTAADPRSVPHVLAVLAQAALECRKPVSTSNIRTILSPAAIRAAAESAGLTVGKERTLTPVGGMLDGSWEVGAVMADQWLEQVHANVKDEREKSVVIATRDAVEANLDGVKARGQKVRTMDIWVSVYHKSQLA